MEELLAAAADVDGDRGGGLAGHVHQQGAERPGVVVREVGEDQLSLLGLQFRDLFRERPRGVLGAHRDTAVPSVAERRAASRTSRAAAASCAVTGFGALSRRAAAMAS